LSQSYGVKVSENGHVAIPAKLAEKHGLNPGAQVVLVDQPEGILLKPAKRPKGKRIVETLLQGGVVRGRTDDWLKMTRGNDR
jgi:AbrB family looped-hinge helix DNA binding protein